MTGGTASSSGSAVLIAIFYILHIIYVQCWCVAVPVGVPAVELTIVNTSLLVKWTALPPELARGRITSYQVLRRTNADEEPVIAAVANVTQHVFDGMSMAVWIICTVNVKQDVAVSVWLDFEFQALKADLISEWCIVLIGLFNYVHLLLWVLTWWYQLWNSVIISQPYSHHICLFT